MKEEKTDFGFEKVNIHEKAKRVRQVFDSVANQYDFMNDAMSLGLHRLWKHHAIQMCQIRPHHYVLDVASGTGDLAISIAKKVHRQGWLTLSDINANMLAHAQRRLLDQGLLENITLCQANAEMLPFMDNRFDSIIIGFGLRNVTDKSKALASMFRVLKPGGRLIVLEFSHPQHAYFSALYDAYSFQILPFLGKCFANDSDSYRYLAESIRMHPNQEDLKQLILKAGFEQCDYHNLAGGIVAVHRGLKF